MWSIAQKFSIWKMIGGLYIMSYNDGRIFKTDFCQNRLAFRALEEENRTHL